MAADLIIHRTMLHRAWWLFGAVIVFAAWWGQPLLYTSTDEHHFLGMFWYSMLGLAAFFWLFPAEQRATAQGIERRYCLLGILPVRRRSYPLTQFFEIRLEQSANMIGVDSIWVRLEAQADPPLMFAYYRATPRGIEHAQRLAQQLSACTGLPFAEVGSEADNPPGEAGQTAAACDSQGEESPGSTGQDAG